MFGSLNELFEFFPSSTSYNWDTLKKMGKVTEDKVVDNKSGLTTITRTFESPGGTFSISSSESFYGETPKESKYTKLKADLQKALDSQNYEEAIKIRDELKALKSKNNK